MSDISKGVLIYNEWFESMEILPSDEYKALVNAIYHLQIHNAPPPEFTGVAKAIAAIIFPYIERRKKQSQNGLASAAARRNKRESSNADATPTTSELVGNDLGNHNKIKPNKIKSIYNKADAPAAKESSSFDLDDFFEAAVRRSLGNASE